MFIWLVLYSDSINWLDCARESWLSSQNVGIRCHDMQTRAAIFDSEPFFILTTDHLRPGFESWQAAENQMSQEHACIGSLKIKNCTSKFTFKTQIKSHLLASQS